MLHQRHVLILLGLAGSFKSGAAQTDTTCPGGVGQLGSEYTIVGDRSNYTGFVWVRPSDGRNVVICNPNCSPVVGYGATNDTPSTLTIDSVGAIDAGTWRIVDAIGSGGADVCYLTVAQTPVCTVNSDRDTAALELDTALLLTVHVNGYYCSEETGISLITGSVMETLKMIHNVSNVTSEVTNKTVSINLSSLGDVIVRFTCDFTSYDVRCSGVQRLLKTPPQCNISSETDTTSLEPGTDITLLVELIGYYCSREAGFDLTTGSVTDVLLQNQTTKNITDTVQQHSFNTTAERFGEVSVIFRCDYTNRTLSCSGISQLTGCSTNLKIGCLGYNIESDMIIFYDNTQKRGLARCLNTAVSTSPAPGSTAAVSTSTSPGSTAAVSSSPDPGSTETSTNNSGTQSNSSTPSEESTTPTSATSTTESPSTDLTLGLAIGIPVFVCVIVIVIACCFQWKRLKRKYVVSGGRPSHQRNEESKEMSMSKIDPEQYTFD